jgi:excisionase family DNA binding protein
MSGEPPLRLAVVEAPRLRLALSPVEAADALGVSRDFLDEHVLPELRVVRRGRKVLVSVAELERWLEESAARTLAG